MPILYGGPKNRGRRVLWLAKELDLPIEIRDLDLGKDEHRTAEFLRVNPNAKLPALVDGDVALFESFAINHYLVHKYGGTLAPRSPVEEGLIAQWTLWAVNELEAQLVAMAFDRFFTPAEKRNPNIVAETLGALDAPFRVLEAYLTDRTYLVGERFTVGDLNVSAVISILPRLGVDVPGRPHMQAWLKRCFSRPAAQGFV